MKKNIKNVSGFTLIELLAVIVVLAIVILMASMAVIPRMNEARRQVFAMEANEAINAASSHFMNGEVTGSGDSFPVSEGGCKSVTIQTLIDSGDFKGKTGYEGTITVTKVGNGYVYAISMTNGKLAVENAGFTVENKVKKSVDIVADNVHDKGATLALPSCPTQSNP